jgi:hypothetical protein
MTDVRVLIPLDLQGGVVVVEAWVRTSQALRRDERLGPHRRDSWIWRIALCSYLEVHGFEGV